jgi:hypothetical protein
MTANMRRVLVVGILASACGSAPDPRCTELCRYVGPPSAGYGNYCNEKSSSLCTDSCGVRIKGLATVCQTCLLEKASLTAPDTIRNQTCSANTCTLSGNGQTCTYDNTNTAQRDACYKTVWPLTAVDCTASYRPVTECSSVCK